MILEFDRPPRVVHLMAFEHENLTVCGRWNRAFVVSESQLRASERLCEHCARAVADVPGPRRKRSSR